MPNFRGARKLGKILLIPSKLMFGRGGAEAELSTMSLTTYFNKKTLAFYHYYFYYCYHFAMTSSPQAKHFSKWSLTSKRSVL